MHGNQTVYTNKLVKLYGPEIGDIMLKQKHEVRKFSRQELETIILVYETIQRVEGLE